MKCSYNDLRHQELPSVDYSQISQIDVELEGQSYTITSEKKGNDRSLAMDVVEAVYAIVLK